jgi:hypothetical protein
VFLPACEEDKPIERKNTEENRDSQHASTENQLINKTDAREKRGRRGMPTKLSSLHEFECQTQADGLFKMRLRSKCVCV